MSYPTNSRITDRISADCLVLSGRVSESSKQQHVEKVMRFAAPISSSFRLVHVLLSDEGNSCGALSHNVLMHDVGAWREAYEETGLVFPLFYLISLLRIFVSALSFMKRYRIGIIANAWSHSVLGIVVVILCKLTKRRSLIRVTGDFKVLHVAVEARFGWFVSKFLLVILSRLERYVLSHSDVIISVSPHLLRRFPKHAYKTVVIPDTNPVMELRPGSLSAKRSRESCRFGILFVGRLEPEKGIEVLLHALSEVKRIPVTCTIIGHGSQRRRIEGIIRHLNLSNTVRLVGRQSQESVYEFMRTADLIVLPSVSEYTPNVLVEAAALEVPIIASSVGGIPYMFRDGVSCVLFETMNPKDLSEKILFLAENPGFRQMLAKNAKMVVNSDFSYDRITAKYAMVFKKMLWQTFRAKRPAVAKSACTDHAPLVV